MTIYLKTVFFSLSLLFITAGTESFGQTGTSSDIKTYLDSYCRDIPWEEVYIHSDRDIYTAGEDIWLTSYLFNRHTGRLSSESSILYLELLNPDNIPVIQKRLLIRGGISPGNAHVPDTLSSGVYTLMAYTNHMKNFLPENAFMRNITVVNPFRNKNFRNKTIYQERLPSQVNMKFYPEGGTMLAGMPVKIAVKVTDEYQRGLSVSGVVRNSRGDSVTGFITDIYGLGSIRFTPAAGNSYYVLHSGTVAYLPLPSEEGCTMSADYLGKDPVTVLINERGDAFSSDRQEYTLLVHSEGNVSYTEKFRIPGFSRTMFLSKASLSKGINHITLFNEKMVPVSERYIYVDKSQKEEDYNLSLSGSFLKREKITLTLAPVDEAGKVLHDNLSMTVIPYSYSVNKERIDDFLVFGTEFGYLPWKTGLNTAGEEDIDNFLLSASSRWIKWSYVISETRPLLTYTRETDVHFLEGMIRERESSSVGNERILTMSVPGKTASFYHSRTKPDGQFNFRLPVDQVQRNLIIQPLTEEQNFSLDIQPPYSRVLPLSASFNTTPDVNLTGIYSDIGARYQLNMIFKSDFKADASEEVAESRPVTRFYGKPEIELIMDDYIRLPVMQEVFFELTPGVRLRERRSEYDMRILNPFTGTYYEDPATVLIDGVVINDLSVLANLDPEVVEKIDIVRTPYVTGDYVHNGIVHVITVPGRFNNISLPDYAVKLPYRVTEPVPLFESPDYSDPVKKQSRIPDFRNTICWEPSLRTDNSGLLRAEFWTSDLAGEYIVDIQGVDGNGEPVSIRKVISVE